MIELRRRMFVRRPPEDVFAVATDSRSFRELYAGVARWEPRDEPRLVPGAEFRVFVHVGPVSVGGRVHVTEHVPARRVAWRSIDGLVQHGAIDFEPRGDGTDVQLSVGYALVGTSAGRVAERLGARIVQLRLEAALLALRRIVEFGDPSREPVGL